MNLNNIKKDIETNIRICQKSIINFKFIISCSKDKEYIRQMLKNIATEEELLKNYKEKYPEYFI